MRTLMCCLPAAPTWKSYAGSRSESRREMGRVPCSRGVAERPEMRRTRSDRCYRAAHASLGPAHPVNQALAGKTYPSVAFPVSEERVGAFARAVGAVGVGVPPTFATAPEISAMAAVIADPELELDFTRVV